MAVSTSSTWADLPGDLGRAILFPLDDPSVSRASGVCRKWRTLVAERISRLAAQRRLYMGELIQRPLAERAEALFLDPESKQLIVRRGEALQAVVALTGAVQDMENSDRLRSSPLYPGCIEGRDGQWIGTGGGTTALQVVSSTGLTKTFSGAQVQAAYQDDGLGTLLKDFGDEYRITVSEETGKLAIEGPRDDLCREVYGVLKSGPSGIRMSADILEPPNDLLPREIYLGGRRFAVQPLPDRLVLVDFDRKDARELWRGEAKQWEVAYDKDRSPCLVILDSNGSVVTLDPTLRNEGESFPENRTFDWRLAALGSLLLLGCWALWRRRAK